MNQAEYIPNDKSSFVIEENGERIGEMIVGVVGNEMAVYHTAVLEQKQGQGLASQLLDAMADYARAHQLMVATYCPFVKSQFSKQEEKYGDIWKKDKPQLTSL